MFYMRCAAFMPYGGKFADSENPQNRALRSPRGFLLGEDKYFLIF